MQRVALTLALLSCGIFAQDKHIITPTQGKAMIAAFQAAKPASFAEFQSAIFPADVLKKLLDQPGAVFFRVYRAMNGAQETFVLAAVDANGRDLASDQNFMIENGEPCPPLCP